VTNSRPKLLDLFCGAGGAAVGYTRAGFEVEGVDIKPQPSYPYKFHLADAMSFDLAGYDAYHASPPCQKWSVATPVKGGVKDSYPDYIEQIRRKFIATGKPWVIENVTLAPLVNPLILCGTMFGLRVRRHRAFETWPEIYFAPAGCNCRKGERPAGGVYSFSEGCRLIPVAGHAYKAADGYAAMGIEWMRNREELNQAIPPEYTEYIGKHLMQAITGGARDKSGNANGELAEQKGERRA
jgi:DNA (cytosine-5)-methyltransferase 1